MGEIPVMLRLQQTLYLLNVGAKAFVYFGQVPDHVKVYCLGQPTLNIAQDHGIQGEIVPS